MFDIESPMNDNNLRNRKHNIISQNQQLVRRFNKTNDEDPDEDETSKAFRKVLMQKQKEANENMTNLVMNIILIVFVTLILINIFLNTQTQNDSSLVKALRILVGKRQSKPLLPVGTTFVTVTSLSKNLINEYMYPSWPWSKSSSQYLMPKEALGNAPVGKLLRQIVRYKSDLGAETSILTNDDVGDFLSGTFGQKCSSVLPNNLTLLQRYQEFGRLGITDGQRLIVTWCLLYSGQAYAVIDLDRYNINIGYKYVQDVKKGLVKNAFVSYDDSYTNSSWDNLSLATSLIIIQSPTTSSVPEGMLKYLIESDVQSSKEFVRGANQKMIELIGNESSDWTRLVMNCEDSVSSSTMKICQSSQCCDLSYAMF